MAFSSTGGFEVKSNREYDEGLGFVRFTRGLGRKRILISKSNSNSDRAPANDSSSLLESLHQDILIRVLCHVDHEDLSRLKLVSKTINKAVKEAKKSHFDYSTPKKRLPYRDAIQIHEKAPNQDDEMEPPLNAPIRRRYISRELDLSKISMVLFK